MSLAFWPGLIWGRPRSWRPRAGPAGRSSSGSAWPACGSAANRLTSNPSATWNDLPLDLGVGVGDRRTGRAGRGARGERQRERRGPPGRGDGRSRCDHFGHLAFADQLVDVRRPACAAGRSPSPSPRRAGRTAGSRGRCSPARACGSRTGTSRSGAASGRNRARFFSLIAWRSRSTWSTRGPCDQVTPVLPDSAASAVATGLAVDRRARIGPAARSVDLSRSRASRGASGGRRAGGAAGRRRVEPRSGPRRAIASTAATLRPDGSQRPCRRGRSSARAGAGDQSPSSGCDRLRRRTSSRTAVEVDAVVGQTGAVGGLRSMARAVELADSKRSTNAAPRSSADLRGSRRGRAAGRALCAAGSGRGGPRSSWAIGESRTTRAFGLGEHVEQGVQPLDEPGQAGLARRTTRSCRSRRSRPSA